MRGDTDGGPAAHIANPKALGFGAFAILLWLYAMILVGWFPEATSTETAQDASFIASASLLIAALASFLRGESWHAIFFAFWSAYAWRLGPQGGEAGPEAFRAWFYLVIGAFHLFLAVGAYRNQKLILLRPLLAFGLTLAYLSAALGSFGLADIFFVIDGYLSLLIALLAFWIAGAELGALPKVAWPERGILRCGLAPSFEVLATNDPDLYFDLRKCRVAKRPPLATSFESRRAKPVG